MPTKIELALKQSQQGVSNDVLILPEHPSDTKVFIVKMEILLESTSNKLLVGTKSVLQPHSSKVGFINHMLTLKLSKSNKESSIREILQLASEISDEQSLVSYQRKSVFCMSGGTEGSEPEGSRLRAEGSDVNLTKRNRGAIFTTL
nr:hypothetical protein [Tanacetum cinerariifolium]